MKTEQILKYAIICFLAFQLISGIAFDVYFFRVPTWLERSKLPNIRECNRLLLRVLSILTYVFIVVGLLRLVNMKKMKLLSIFKFPIYYFVASNFLWLLTTLFSVQYSFIMFHEGSPWFVDVVRSVNLIFFALILFYFYFYQNFNWENENQAHVFKASKASVNVKNRFINRLLDFIVIIAISGMNFTTLTTGGIKGGLDMMFVGPAAFILLSTFVYYFILEFLFLQTIGKLHNDSVVNFEEGRFKSILIRTLSRFIPFEAFSFFGKKGWHDSYSKTTVVEKE